MLYITTRSGRDAFTAHRTLETDRAPDEGLFIPMKFPHVSEDEVRDLISSSFEESVAKVVNLFYSSALTQWDVGFCIGRNTVRIAQMNSKIHFVELWHNPSSCAEYITNGLFRRIYGKETEAQPTEWFRIVVRIAIVFGVYGELCRQEKIVFGDCYDYSLVADDFSYPIAVLYAAQMGLPTGTLICNCTETHAVWNLVHRGEYNTAAYMEALHGGIERLLLLRLGEEKWRSLQNMRNYRCMPNEHDILRKNLFCVVSGADRWLQTVGGIFRNTGSLVTPSTAKCIAGLGDYRAKMGESKFTLVIEEDSPAKFSLEIEKATGIPMAKIGQYIKE